MTRRGAIRAGLGLLAGGAMSPGCAAVRQGGLRVAAFSADVTVPMGHGMMGGAWLSTGVADPLEAIGFILLGSGDPVVFVSVDWCEIRNDAYRAWQKGLADAVGTSPDRVMISTVHQHDAPVADLGAEVLLRLRGLKGTVCDPGFHREAVERVAAAAKVQMGLAVPLTHIGMGRAKVEGVVSNRRYTLPDGTVRWDRTSSTRNVFAREADPGLVDPWLRTLSFWSGARPVVAVNFLAVHPMSHYGQGMVSADFPGRARRAHQGRVNLATPARGHANVIQIYASGCSGNVTAGKYNDGSPPMRETLAERVRTAMASAWEAIEKRAVQGCRYRVESLVLEPRQTEGFTEAALMARLVPSEKPFAQCLAAMGLSWLQRVKDGRPLQVPCLDFGPAALLLLPGESYLEYQLHAQGRRPGGFVCTAGYGDGATGYVPLDRHWTDGDTNLGDWCWVAPGAEARMKAAIDRALG